MRKTGLDTVGNIHWGSHFCQFYRNKQELIDVLVPYFKAGLENNELCLWITSDPLNIEEAKRELNKKVKRADDYINKGQVKIVEANKWYTPSGEFNSAEVIKLLQEKEIQAQRKGYDGLRVAGNAS